MARRRGKGEGGIYFDETRQLWVGEIQLARGLDGGRRRKKVYGRTRAAAAAKMQAAQGVTTTSSPTLATFLDEWLRTGRTKKGKKWTASTRRGYAYVIEDLIKPALGHLRVEQVTTGVLRKWFNDHEAEHGARRRITLAHAVLRSALGRAEGEQYVARNVAKQVAPPAPDATRPIVVLAPAQAEAFLMAAKEHRLGALFSVALACGLRLGEATGLRWDDVDLETGLVRIRVQLQPIPPPDGVGKRRLELVDLKTKSSRRDLELPTPCLELLRAHRTQQREDRLKAGALWVETGLVFTTYARRQAGRRVHGAVQANGAQVGGALHPRNVSRVFAHLLAEADLRPMRFHDLRHSAASLLLAQGVPLEAVSKLLGHSQLSITSDLYTTLMRPTAARAARAMEQAIRF